MDRAEYTNIGMTGSGRIRDEKTCRCPKKEQEAMGAGRHKKFDVSRHSGVKRKSRKPTPLTSMLVRVRPTSGRLPDSQEGQRQVRITFVLRETPEVCSFEIGKDAA